RDAAAVLPGDEHDGGVDHVGRSARRAQLASGGGHRGGQLGSVHARRGDERSEWVVASAAPCLRERPDRDHERNAALTRAENDRRYSPIPPREGDERTSVERQG